MWAALKILCGLQIFLVADTKVCFLINKFMYTHEGWDARTGSIVLFSPVLVPGKETRICVVVISCNWQYTWLRYSDACAMQTCR